MPVPLYHVWESENEETVQKSTIAPKPKINKIIKNETVQTIIRTLEEYLQIVINEDQKNWDEAIPLFLEANWLLRTKNSRVEWKPSEQS